MSKQFYRLITVVICLVLCQSVWARNLIMTAPPREKPIEGLKLYGPLAAAISKELGKKVVYKHPNNWLRYQRNMRNGDYDIVFDGPHFASWRIEHVGHTAIVKLPGTLEFFLVVKKSAGKINSLADLIGKKICGISPPNLSTLSVLARFNNPVRQPVILGIRGGMGKVYRRFINGACTAAVLRNAFFYKKLDKLKQKELKILIKSEPLPNQVITVSKRISVRDRGRITKAILYGRALDAAKPILTRFKRKTFVTTTNEEYLVPRELLEGVIFGW